MAEPVDWVAGNTIPSSEVSQQSCQSSSPCSWRQSCQELSPLPSHGGAADSFAGWRPLSPFRC
eukprot:3781776-Karenia_brevis.AAC.1